MLSDEPIIVPPSPQVGESKEPPLPESPPEFERAAEPPLTNFLDPKLEKFSHLMKIKRKKRNHLAAVLNIGSFLKTHVDELFLLRKSIASGETDIEATWSHIEHMTEEARGVLSEDERDSIDAFKEWILGDVELISKIGDDNLIQLGQNLNYYRLVFVCLVQNHSPENREALQNFNLKYLSRPVEDAATISSLAPMMHNCPSLPIEALNRLGGEHQLIAEEVLNDIKGHKDFNEISEHFYFVHWPDEAPERNEELVPTPQPSPRKTTPPPSPVKPSEKKEHKPKGRSALSHIADAMLGGSAVAAGFGLYLSEPALAAFVLYAPYVAVPVVAVFGVYQMKKAYDGRYKTPDPVKGDPVMYGSDSDPGEEVTKKEPPKTAPKPKAKKVEVAPIEVEEETKPIKLKKKKKRKPV